MGMSEDLHNCIEAVQGILLPLSEGEFSEKLKKVSVYLSTVEERFGMINSTLESILLEANGDQESYRKAVDDKLVANRASLASFIKFARLNLDLAMAQALDKLVRRPKSANKMYERKRMVSLGKWFDQLPDPAPTMIEHFKASSNPLDKYLMAGQWGHDYLRRRKINPEAYDVQLCEHIACSDSAAVRIVQNYGKLSNAIDAVEEKALNMLDAASSTPKSIDLKK
jgi:hypothetical protein